MTDATPRKAMTPARRRRILAKSDGQCARLGCTVSDRLQIDHIICLELGGPDTDDNCEALCEPHHKAKTARDAKMIARARRLRLKADPETRPKSKRPLVSRGFDKRFRVKMNRTVERRA